MTYDDREKSRDGGAPIECYRFVVGSTVYRWTSSDTPVNFDGELYEIEPIRSSGADFSAEDHSGSITVYLSRLNPVAQLFLPYTPPSSVELTLYRFHENEPDFVIGFSGNVVSGSFGGTEAAMTCARKNSAFKRKVPRLAMQKRCPLVTYGLSCGLNKDDFKDVGTVLTVSGYTLQVLLSPVRADGWYTFGWIETADGVKRSITDHTGDMLTLEAPFFAIAPGDPISVFWGDDHLEATCRDKFANSPQFIGEPRIPQKDPQQTGLNA